jgi:hypothetical protein
MIKNACKYTRILVRQGKPTKPTFSQVVADGSYEIRITLAISCNSFSHKVIGNSIALFLEH